ncbi:class I adenylate-forming enzyme family protein [Pseudonocardia nigra]|uniref:class I adenylate-forming enzyme family protein n=1 Tax=Pseudonocardia nigra TaxID=1921578 RepID=UPI0027E30B72|nr:class I adenylate-forming enzyme family protein [Pseudonocardia nigra]
MTPNPPVLGSADVPADLLALAQGAARELTGRAVRAGSRVAVDPGPAGRPVDVLAWLLGADLLGAATLVVEPGWTDRERAAVLGDARPHVVVTGAPAPTTTPVVPHGDESTRFYLPTTSGSSGRPAVLVRSRASWLRSFAALGPLPGPVLVPGPLSSSLFLFGALHALWCGAELRVRPRLRAADAREVASLHVVPAMLADLLAELERTPGPCALRTVVCGGAHVGDGLRARFARVLPGAELMEYYGSAEHSLIAVRRGGPALRPVPGVEVAVRDGELWVRSPLAFDGHLRSGAVVASGSGWSTVGDRAELTDSGELVVLGRGSATISSGGRLVAAEEVESVLRGVPGVDDVLVSGTPHATLGAVVTAVVQAGSPPALRELCAAARAGLAPGKRPRRWLVTAALPRTASGKPARAAVAEQLAAGTFPAEPLR